MSLVSAGSNAASSGPMPGLTTTDEDPGIWRDERGHFHAIFHGPGHAWSADGVDSDCTENAAT